MARQKILLFDIETTPIIGYTWGKWEQNVIDFIAHSHLLSWSAKWLGGKQVTKGLIDYPGYAKNKDSDQALVKEIWGLLDQADIIVAHNGKAFDTKKVNARFSYWQLPPPSPYKQVDTKEMAKRYFAYTSNSLNDIADYLGIGRKLAHSGFDLWKRCMAGDEDAWVEMKRYNAQDVKLLEAIYLRMLPYMANHPVVAQDDTTCPKCGSDNLQRRGEARTLARIYQRFQCLSCGGWGRYPKAVAAVAANRNMGAAA
jgi:predicted RNA-binding Zn-ribbon protein involved in translation (DUF1610 family)